MIHALLPLAVALSARVWKSASIAIANGQDDWLAAIWKRHLPSLAHIKLSQTRLPFERKRRSQLVSQTSPWLSGLPASVADPCSTHQPPHSANGHRTRPPTMVQMDLVELCDIAMLHFPNRADDRATHNECDLCYQQKPSNQTRSLPASPHGLEERLHHLPPQRSKVSQRPTRTPSNLPGKRQPPGDY